jgi:hypothetical protein
MRVALLFGERNQFGTLFLYFTHVCTQLMENAALMQGNGETMGLFDSLA